MLFRSLPSEDSVPTKQCQEAERLLWERQHLAVLDYGSFDEWAFGFSPRALTMLCISLTSSPTYIKKSAHRGNILGRQIFYHTSTSIFLSLSLFFLTMLGLLGGAQRVRAELIHSMWDLSFLTTDRIYVPCVGKQILNHWTTRDVPSTPILKLLHLCFNNI